MDNSKIDLEVKNIILEYVKLIKKKYNIKSVYIFGSYAKGKETSDSDIDVAVISNDFEDQFDALVELLVLKHKIDLRIEPHPFSEKDFENENPLVNEIKNTGYKVA